MVVEQKLNINRYSGSISRAMAENHKSSAAKCLLVDDEPVCIEIEREMLESLGYEVTTIQDAAEALRRFKDIPNTVDLVVLNTFMHGMSGDALAGELMSIDPYVPVVICPRSDERVNRRNDSAGDKKRVLQKAISMFEMVRMVRAVQDNCEPRAYPK